MSTTKLQCRPELLRQWGADLCPPGAETATIPAAMLRSLIADALAAHGHEPFGIFVERADGTQEFRRMGETFTPTAQAYKATKLYAVPVVAPGDAVVTRGFLT